MKLHRAQTEETTLWKGRVSVVLLVAVSLLHNLGCASSSRSPSASDVPPPRAGGPDWEEVDKTVARVKERERVRKSAVTTTYSTESGFFPMTDDEYAAALESARAEVRKANPDLSASDVESEAVKRADEAKRQQDMAFTGRAKATVEIVLP
jgi:hypothetical protein